MRLAPSPGTGTSPSTTASTSVEAELRRLFDEKAQAAAALGPGPARLWRLAGEQALGGKLLRPRLFLETLDALHSAPATRCGPEDPAGRGPAHAETVRIAAAIELLHLAFLIHDDVIDRDLTRRGRPNLIAVLARDAGAAERRREHGPARVDGEARERQLHWARSCAILLGDLLLAEVHQIWARAELPRERRLRLLDLLATVVAESVAGEQADIGFGAGITATGLDAVLEMSARKTAAYTFELPLVAAAVLSDSGPEVEALLARAARLLGLAYQLQDDLLSTFGDPRAHGKDAFSDLREGKETAVIAFARTTAAWPGIAACVGGRTLGLDEARLVRDLLTACGAEAFVRGLIAERLLELEALLFAERERLGAEACAVLAALARGLEDRCA